MPLACTCSATDKLRWPSQARLGRSMNQRASPPRRLGEWLLQRNEPSEIRAIASYIGYPRQHVIPVLASALLAHFVETVPSGQRLVAALFSTTGQSQALVGQVARALQTGGKFDKEGTLRGDHHPFFSCF